VELIGEEFDGDDEKALTILLLDDDSSRTDMNRRNRG